MVEHGSRKYFTDMEKDELRDGFLVTGRRKRIWNVELNLLAEFADICQRYSLRWQIDYGTLLGAARHGGFIPWDDDVDLTMPRADYEQLQDIMAGMEKYQDCRGKFFFQTCHTDTTDNTIAKLRDCRTTAICRDRRQEGRCQGIWIDIFPLDAVPDGTARMERVWEIQRWLIMAVSDPKQLQQLLDSSAEPPIAKSTIKRILKLSALERMREYERFAARHFHESAKINYFVYEMAQLFPSMDAAWYEKTVLLPFEGMHLPAPAGYEQVLTKLYGDWRTPVKEASSHGEVLFSPDIPYYELLAKGDLALLF